MEADKYYSKVLVASDIKDRLSVPEKWMEILEHLFTDGLSETPLRVLDWLGNSHDLRLATRKKGGYRKPVVQAHEWKVFVGYSGLQAGDKIFIYRLDRDNFRGATHGVVALRPNSDGFWTDVPTQQRSEAYLIPFF